MKIASAREMAAVDRHAAEHCGVPVAALMEEAGRRIAEVAAVLLGGLSGRRIMGVCGRGNNGGDGFVAARLLREAGADPLAALAGEIAELRPDARAAYESAARAGVACFVYPDEPSLETLVARAGEADLIVDALLGTGFTPPARGTIAAAIRLINRVGRNVLAVDLPSGLSSDEGRIAGDAVRASATVTFGYPKRGLVEYPASSLAGRLWCGAIGFPPETDALVPGDLNLVTPVDLAPLLRSIDVLKRGKVEYEFRMTVVPGIHREEDITRLASQLRAGRRFVLQNFNPENPLDPELKSTPPYDPEVLKRMERNVQAMG
jgi:NAD(P)H-hydrate epimerase